MKIPALSFKPDLSKWGSFQIAAGYLLLGALWILFSDKLAEQVAPNEQALSQIGIYKGWGYVLVTAILLYWLIKRHAMSIRDANQRYKLLAENASDVIWLLDPLKDRFKYISPSVLKLRGYTAEEVMAQLLIEAFLPEDFERQSALTMERLSLFQAKGSGTVSYVDEIVQPHRDGSKVYTEAISTYFFNEQNEIEVMGVTRDISRRKEAERKQRASEKKYQELLDQASDGIFIADSSERYTLVNEEACRLVGYTKEELLSMNLSDLVAPEDLETVPLRLDKLRAGKVVLSERKLLRKDRSRIVCEISGKMLPDGSFQSIVRDITERKVTEDALKRSERRYRSLFENMTNGYARCQMLYDEEGKPYDFIYLDVNRAFRELTGLKDVIGRRVSEVIPGIQESNSELLEFYGRVASTGKPDKFETYIPTLGSGIWFSVSAYSPEKDFFVAVFEIITERKRAEQALRRNYEQLLSLIEQAPLSIAMFDGDMNYLATSRRWIHEYGRGYADLIGLNHYKVNPDLPDQWRDAQRKGLAGESSKNDDDLWIQSDGRKNWLRWSITPWKDNDGKIGGIIISAEDISERKRAEVSAFKSEVRYHRVLDAMLEGCQIIDFDWRYVYVNEVAAEHGRHTSEELLNHTMMEMYPGIEQTELFSVLQWCMGDRTPRRMENQFVFPDGSIGWFELSIQPTEEGIFILSTDITERRQAGEKLQESEHRYRELVQNANSAILRWKRDGSIAFFNEYAQAFFGYGSEEIIGRGVNILVPETESNGGDLSTLVKHIIEHPEQFVNFVNENICRDGRRVWMAWTNKPIYDENGDVTEILAVGVDITERKKAEDTVRDLARFPEENPNPVIRTNWNGKIIYANLAGEAWLSEWKSKVGGFPPDEWKNGISDIYERGVKQAIDIAIQGRTFSTMIVPIKETGTVNLYGSDITERKRAEEQAHYQASLLTSVSDAIIATDEKQFVTSWNRAAEELYGWSAEEAIGKLAREVVQSDFTDAQRADAIQSLAATGHFKFEILQYHRNGRPLWVDGNTITLHDSEGKVTGYVSVNRDISGRKQSEEALRQSEQKFSILFEKAAFAAFLSRLSDGVIVDVNESFEKAFGYARQEAIGKTSLELEINPDSDGRARVLAALQESNSAHDLELTLQTRSGETRIFSVNVDIVAIDGQNYILNTARDITERKQAEATRNKLTERLNLATQSAHLGIWDWDIQKNMIVWDDQMYALYGVKPGEFGGAYEAWLNGVHPDDREPSNEVSAQAVRGEREYDTEFRVLWPDRSVHWLKANGQVFRDEHGTPLRMIGVNYDITELKRTENVLRDSEERLRLSLQAAKQGLYDLNVQTGNAIVNREYAEMLGYDYDAFVETNAAWIERLHPDDQEITAKAYRDYISGKLPEYRVEFRQRTRQGNWKWILSLGRVVEFDAEGKPLRMLGTHTDITERKRAEQALRESENKFATLFNQAALPAVLSQAPNHEYVDVNNAWLDLFGYTREDVIGKTSLQIGVSRNAEVRKRAIDEIQQRNPVRNMEQTLYSKSGSPKTILTNVNWLEIAGKEYAFTSLQDITERKRSEEALHQSQENFARAFNSNPAALAITSVDDGKFLIINETYTTTMGYEPAEILGRTAASLKIYVNPDERDQLLRQLGEQGRVRNYELLVRSKSGETRDLLISMEPIQYDNDPCILSTFLDITERKHMEDDLRRSNAELEQFAYVASHDLQEPLRAVAGMTQLLQKKYQGQLDERADEYIGHTVEAANRMQALITDLLEYSRVDRRGKPFERVHVDDCLHSALRNLDVSIRESGANIQTDELPTVTADATQMTQLFQNLIGNSIKFRGRKEPQIHVGATKLNDAWQFSVHDNGIGIELQYFERIFLVFQRLHTRREYAGTGIGLSLCKKIIERHGGRIWVEFEPGQGSTFYFTIPTRSIG